MLLVIATGAANNTNEHSVCWQLADLMQLNRERKSLKKWDFGFRSSVLVPDSLDWSTALSFLVSRFDAGYTVWLPSVLILAGKWPIVAFQSSFSCLDLLPSLGE